MRKQVRGFLGVILAGRDRKMERSRFFMGVDDEGSEVWRKAEKGFMADAWPEAECPFCRCRHVGGIRCFLTQEEDRSFLTASVRPYSRALSLAREEEERALAASVLGEHEMGERDLDPSSFEGESLNGVFE
uniref:Uncharacterized protein n=1 Tax=Octactis speculum TaxID=3111310 RepID=A0A7S2AWH0_9STRA|mmetsp:Transcript_16792/g.22560  ORF Transcript_16792/g.22560 Transcript_16792/m.22560 type:complete len:131 (+) Transcript_16792:125-517(+)